jgi:hypothetical protein
MEFLNKIFGEKVTLYDITWKDVDRLIRKDPNQLGKKWITVYFSIYFKKNENDGGEIERTAIDITSIINNTHSMFEKNGDFLGCENPYLNIGVLSESAFHRPHTIMVLSKIFKCTIKELPDQYHLIFHPVKENSDEFDLYSLERLCYDMYILGHASDYISNRYQITVNTSQNSYNPEMMKDDQGMDVPLIAHFVRLLVYRYPVKERFEFQKEKPALDTWLFGGGIEPFNYQINDIRKKQPNSEWTKKVNEIIGDIKK